jgi:serine/threonine protein kinase
MAPEQLFGEELGPAVDHWAIGVMMYECLVGRRPIAGGNLGQIVRALTHGRIVPVAQVRPHLPRNIASVIDRLLVLDPRKRLSDLAELSAVLRPHALIIEERPSHAPTMLIPIPPMRRAWPWRRWRKRVRRSVRKASPLALVLAVLMASAVFAAGVFAGGAVGGH